jgi:hypothetical protein
LTENTPNPVAAAPRFYSTRLEIEMKSITITFLLCLSFLLHCSSSKLVLSNSYSFPDLRNPTLGISINDNDLIIRCDGAVEPEKGKGNSNKIKWDYFEKQLYENIKKRTIFKNLEFENIYKLTTYHNVVVGKFRDQHKISIPNEKTQYVSKTGKIFDFILFIENVNIHYEYNNYGWADAILIESSVVIWDNIQKTCVKYGYVKISNSFCVAEDWWPNVTNRYYHIIFDNTPFFIN